MRAWLPLSKEHLHLHLRFIHKGCSIVRIHYFLACDWSIAANPTLILEDNESKAKLDITPTGYTNTNYFELTSGPLKHWNIDLTYLRSLVPECHCIIWQVLNSYSTPTSYRIYYPVIIIIQCFPKLPSSCLLAKGKPFCYNLLLVFLLNFLFTFTIHGFVDQVLQEEYVSFSTFLWTP